MSLLHAVAPGLPMLVVAASACSRPAARGAAPGSLPVVHLLLDAGGSAPSPTPFDAGAFAGTFAREGPVVLENSGSTNALGYRVEVARSGEASYQCGPDKGKTTIAGDLVQKLYADVARVGPLSRLPVIRCPKSTSFGTRTYVALGSDRSPDIQCLGDGVRGLMADVDAVVGTLHLDRRRRR